MRWKVLSILTLVVLLGMVLSPGVMAQSNAELAGKVRALEKQQQGLQAEVDSLRERLELILGPEETNRRYNVPVEDSPLRGSETAEVTLVAFGDFQSDYTTRANYAVKRLLQEYAGKVRFMFKHYPLSAIHPQATEAALAALAAEKQGKGWEMFDQLLLNSRRLSSSIYLLLAQQLGLDITRFDTDRRSLWALERLSKDEKLAVELGVTGVPTFFLNGKRLSSWRYDYLKDELTKALQAKGK